MRTRTKPDHDLFGRSSRKRKPLEQVAIERYHRETQDGKMARLRWLRKVFPEGSMLFIGLEPVIVFNEAKMTFLDGHFVGTMLLACSFVEHVFVSTLRQHGHFKEARGRLSEIIKHLRKRKLADLFLLDKAERLRRKRNPFVHLGSLDTTKRDTLFMASFRTGTEAFASLERDAKDALALMYQVARGKGLRPAK